MSEVGDGAVKTFPLRGIKDSPPYMHDGHLLTLDDTVEFFNLVLGTKLTSDEKRDLVAFLLTIGAPGHGGGGGHRRCKRMLSGHSAIWRLNIDLDAA
jgi:hypothetical protein